MVAMNLADARSATTAAFARMNVAYGEPVFNEWVLVSLRAEGSAILAYDGPRPEKFKQQFTLDLASLLKEIATQKLGVGDFAFASDAAGTHYDACMRVGVSTYLFANHLTRTMTGIRANPMWLHAQKAWAELSQKFLAEPLE
jgi:hypothetical protein